MKLNAVVLVYITIVAQAPWQCNCDSAVQYSEESKVTDIQAWDDNNGESKLYREGYEGESETTKRPRNRGSKRRRRLRQRPRTTTERTEENFSGDELHIAASSVEGTEAGGETTPRRRPTGKRRRRPLRRYHDSELPNGRPRRRKGSRKRIRPPPLIESEELETTTILTFDYDVSSTNKFTPEEEMQTENPSLSYESSFTNKNLNYTTRESLENNAPELNNNNANEGFKHIIIIPEQPKNNKDNELLTLQKTEEKIVEVEPHTSEFGNKIFDRKALFSTSRKLPETSATLRRRLIPRIKTSFKNSSYNSHVRMIKPLSNLESELGTKNKIKNEAVTKPVVPKGFAQKPEHIEPYQLLNKIIIQTSTEINTPEPNYPQLDLFFRKNKSSLIEETKLREPTEITITTTLMEIETTTEPQNEIEEINVVEENLTPINNVAATNLSHFDDEVYDLLKTEAGQSRLQRILELRNMTLPQLLDHRERGSNNFLLSDIFTKTEQITKEIDSTNEEVTRYSNLNVTNENALKSNSTKNLLDSLPTGTSDITVSNIEEDQVLQQNIVKDTSWLNHRESRIFDSMPEFTTTKPIVSESGRPYPTLRIIPNPKLKPISIRGDYKEIKISNIPSTFIKNDIEKIVLLEDGENYIPHRSKIPFTINTENKENLFLFKKIPVSVKSAIVVSAAILILAIFGFLSVLVSCRLRQKKARLRAKQDILCEHLQNDDFMTSHQSLSPVLTKHGNRGPIFTTQAMHSNPSNRHYYLWRTLRKTFQYD